MPLPPFDENHQNETRVYKGILNLNKEESECGLTGVKHLAVF